MILLNEGNNNTITSSSILGIGYFPILNHAQAVIGLANGDFQKAVGNDITIKPEVIDSGLFAGIKQISSTRMYLRSMRDLQLAILWDGADFM
jgi:hypothetical protein